MRNAIPFLIFPGRQRYDCKRVITRFCCFLAQVSIALVVPSIYCQIDSTSLLNQAPPSQALVSKNKLLTPERVQKALVHARESFLRGRYESAQRDVQRALEICPHCAWAHTIQGALQLQSGNYPEAAAAFQRAIDLDPAAGSAYLGIGVVCNIEGRFKDALIPLDRAVQYLPGSWLLYFEIALAHLGTGESKAGLKYLAQTRQLTGNDPRQLSGIAYLQAIAQFELKDYEGGKQFFEEAVKCEPNGTYAALANKWLQRLPSRIREANAQTAELNKSSLDRTK
jgi:tetratricopeptide (TPR) repeat protein